MNVRAQYDGEDLGAAEGLLVAVARLLDRMAEGELLEVTSEHTTVLGSPTDTVRVPVSRRPTVCGVVGGLQRSATSSSVIPRARLTSLIRVIIGSLVTNQTGFYSVLQFCRCGKH